MPRIGPTGWAAVLAVLVALSLSMNNKSYQVISGAAQMLMQQDLFSPTTTTVSQASDVSGAAAAQNLKEGTVSREGEETTTTTKTDKPLNVVVMYADDWRHDAIGIAGTLPVETPFLDWLAQNRGMRFTHNCAPTSICWASRAIYMTGTYHARNKAVEPGSEGWYEFFPQSFPALLRKAGYWVAHIGKWHTWNSQKIQHYYHHFQEYYGRHWYPGNPTPLHATTRNQNDAIKFLKGRPNKFPGRPFLLTLAFFAPHSWDGNPDQYLPQTETFHVYENITIHPPYDMEASFKRLPKFFTERNEARHRYHKRFDEPTKYDRMMKNYFRLITGVDTACRAVWEELEAQGLLEETVFIFTTDNGYYHGEHGLAGKWYPHEESIRIPLIIYDPRMPEEKRGTTNDDFTLSVDLAPTILGAANIAKPEVMQGRDIADLYLRPDSPPWRTEFFYEHPVHLSKDVIPGSTALVRKTMKYIHWPDWGVEQLFNLTNDPLEEQDEIKNPAYAEIYREMQERHDMLREWVK